MKSGLVTSLSTVIVVCAVGVGARPDGVQQPAAAQAPRAPCSDLAKLTWPAATVTAAEEVTAGDYSPGGGGPGPGAGRPLANLPAFCRVALTVAPAIRIEIWMPRDNWNGRFVGEGGGGYAGQISYPGLAERLRTGYASASTDTGHGAAAGGTFAINGDGTLNTGLIVDFAERSLRELAVKAKDVIRAYYGSAPAHSYWNGCSTGGRQGLMAVQRFPEEYDGLVIGAPAINWDRFIPAELWPQVVMNTTLGGPISAAKLTAVTSAAVTACDAADGVTDGVIDDPRACTYDPRAMLCKAGEDPSACLTSTEADAVRKIWNGPTTASGERLWFGLERGAPLNGLAGTMPFNIASTHFQFWIHQDPKFDWHTVTEAQFEREFRESQRKFHDTIGTDDPNLEPFRRHGGKMIIWHGEADQLIPPRGTINYFNRVVQANGGQAEVDRFARLYMAPGVGHCGGGTGPAPTGLFGAVVDWVERGTAPTTVIATRAAAGPGGGPGRGVAPTAVSASTPARRRPLCPYPTAAHWKGTGSTDDAANFACVASAPKPADFAVR